MHRARIGICLAALAGLAPLAPVCSAQTAAGTAFTYQGRLDENGHPADGLYDFEFRLANAASGSGFVGFAQFIEDVQVVNGLFTTKVNFGTNFNGDARFVEVSVRPGSSTGAYTALSPRQELTPAPYALGLALPMSETQSSASPLISLDQNGTGGCMTLSSGAADCLNVSTDGAGDALYAHTTGAGVAVRADSSAAGSYSVLAQAHNGATPLWAYNLGTSGYGAFIRSESVSNATNCVEVQQNGAGAGIHVNSRAGNAGFFENTNASNTWNPLKVFTNGPVAGMWSRTTGTGGAAKIEIANSSNASPALDVTTTGTGLAGKFTGGDVQVNGNLYAQMGTVLNRATPIAFGTFDYGTGEFISSSGNVTLTWLGNSTYRVLVVGEGDPDQWTVQCSLTYNEDSPSRLHMIYSFPPQFVLGQPGNGSVRFKLTCIAGCDNEFWFAPNVNFVIYKGN